ncbi:MAG: helix-turn-helix transcriptional regulator [Pseudomonadota bacterium]
MNDPIVQKWQSQMYKGYLELCVLLALRRHAMYGGQLRAMLLEADLAVNEGTLYPLLNRMERNGWLCSTWQMPEAGGHPRRLYRVRSAGLHHIDAMVCTNGRMQMVLHRLEKE